MSVTLSLFAGVGMQFFDNNGKPLTGGKIFSYAAGTTTPQTTYVANSDAVAHANPIILDAAGRVPSGGEIWLTTGIGYKFVVKSSTDVVIATYDNVPSSAQPPAANDADSIAYEQGHIAPAGSFIAGKTYRIVSVGTTDYTLIGAISNSIGLHFVATGAGSGTGTAELSTTVEDKLREIVSVKDFGAVGDGVADDTLAIQTAFALTGRSVFIPAGTYKVSSTLTPACAEIFGEGELASIIEPTAAVTKVISLGGAAYPTAIKSFRINGANTTNATGVYFGDASSMACLADSLRCSNFSGATAVAFRVGDLLKSTLRKLTAENCSTGFLIERSSPTFPTTVNFDSCVATNCAEYGEKIVDGYSITHSNCVYESSGKEGVLILPSAGREALEIGFDYCWFEANNGGDNSKFHFVAGDGTALGGGTIRAWLRNCYFDTNAAGTAAKSIQMNGSAVAAFTIYAPVFAGAYTGAISVENNSYGEITGWVGQFNYANVVNDPNSLVSTWVNTQPQLDAAWTAYTPTYASEAGDETVTFSGGAVTKLARYKLIGKTLYLSLSWTGVLNAVTPLWISLSLPPGLLSFSNELYAPAAVTNSTNGIGVARPDGGNKIRFYLADQISPFTALAFVGGSASLVIEIQ